MANLRELLQGPDEARRRRNILPFGQPPAVDHALLQIVRNIARDLFVRAVQMQLPRFGDAGELKPPRMVAPGRAARPWADAQHRNGYWRNRDCQAQGDDRRASGLASWIGFTSVVLPVRARRTRKPRSPAARPLAARYVDRRPRRRSLPAGKDTTNLSPSMISGLYDQSQGEYERPQQKAVNLLKDIPNWFGVARRPSRISMAAKPVASMHLIPSPKAAPNMRVT